MSFVIVFDNIYQPLGFKLIRHIFPTNFTTVFGSCQRRTAPSQRRTGTCLFTALTGCALCRNETCCWNNLEEMAKVGRRRQCPIWDFFEYDSETNKCKCLAEIKTGEICGALLKGKNPTNLKAHLRSTHKEAYTAYENKEAESLYCLY